MTQSASSAEIVLTPCCHQGRDCGRQVHHLQPLPQRHGDGRHTQGLRGLRLCPRGELWVSRKLGKPLDFLTRVTLPGEKALIIGGFNTKLLYI